MPALADTLDEADETFAVTLTAATNATIAAAQGIGTITDDDASPGLSINDVTAAEGNSGSTNLTFTVTLSAASGRAVTFLAQTADVTALAGSDYASLASTTVTIVAGAISRTVSVAVLGDPLDEAAETFVVNLTSASNAVLLDAQGSGTITDDDASPSIVISDTTVIEGNTGTASASFLVTLSAGSGQTVTVSAQTANHTALAGSDYAATGPTTLSFSPGEFSKAFLVPVLGDTVVESNESFFVNLASGTNASISDAQGLGAITDDDARVPTVSLTSPASLATVSGATLGGTVGSDGGAAITERVVVYSVTSANPDPAIGGPGVTKLVVAGTTVAEHLDARKRADRRRRTDRWLHHPGERRAAGVDYRQGSVIGAGSFQRAWGARRYDTGDLPGGCGPSD